jgi:hypothetical protein
LGKPEGLIFTNKGKHIDPDLFDEDIFAPIREKAKLDSVRFHDLRHFCVDADCSGQSPKYVSDQLGHSSVQITFDLYGRLFPQANAAASESSKSGSCECGNRQMLASKRRRRRFGGGENQSA